MTRRTNLKGKRLLHALGPVGVAERQMRHIGRRVGGDGLREGWLDTLFFLSRSGPQRAFCKKFLSVTA